MKKLIISFLLFGFQISNAQYNVLLNFNGTNGKHPYVPLTLSGNRLFGMTYEGGIHDSGCIFSIDTNGNGYKDLFDFNGISGGYPSGDLTISGNIMYGMTLVGAVNGYGNIFCIDTNGNRYKDLYDFTNPISSVQEEISLVLSGKTLFGITEIGGAYGYGNIFSIDTNGSRYADIFDFNDTNGALPVGPLIISGNILYGMAAMIGASTNGCIFSIDTNGNRYTDIHNFNDTNGKAPVGSLTLSGNILYGMTHDGGLGYGCIFSIDTNGNQYKDKYNFNFSTGAFPTSSLRLSGNMLYGMANGGGGVYDGCIFSFDAISNVYEELFAFDMTDGGGPPGSVNTHFSSVTLAGDNLYGITLNGGANDSGVVFSLNYKTAGINNVASNHRVIHFYPNPSSGAFMLRVESEKLKVESLTVRIYNMLGEKVYSSPLNLPQPGDFEINISNQPNGVYLYRVLNTDGGLVGEGKLIIQK